MGKLFEKKPASPEKDLPGQIAALSQELRAAVYNERMKIQQQQNQLLVQLTVIGDLEGSIITAHDAARRDPAAALEKLLKAKAAFGKG